MRPRIQVTSEQIVEALDATDGDLEAAADWLEVVWGIEVSGRTLRRRMAEMGIRLRRTTFQEEAA